MEDTRGSFVAIFFGGYTMTDKECWKECEYANPKSEIISAYLMKKQENEQLKAQIEKMKNCDNCKNLLQCTNRRYEKMTSGKMTMIRFPCCWELAK